MSDRRLLLALLALDSGPVPSHIMVMTGPDGRPLVSLTFDSVEDACRWANLPGRTIDNVPDVYVSDMDRRLRTAIYLSWEGWRVQVIGTDPQPVFDPALPADVTEQLDELLEGLRLLAEDAADGLGSDQS